MLMTRYSIKTTSTSNTFNSGNLSAATPKRSGASPWGGLEGASKRPVASPWGGLEGASWGGLVGAASWRGLVGLWLGLLLLCLLLVSCSDDDGGSRTSDLATIELYVAVPAAPADGTRIGDPGVDDGEDQSDWNTLALMFEYFDDNDAPTGKRYLHTITAEQFNSLPAFNNDGTIKRVTLPMTKGRVKVYGVTYSSDVKSDIAGQLTSWASETTTSLQDLTIPNDYAEGDAAERAKFLSVATGFYDDKDKKDGTPDIFNIEDVITGGLAGTIPVMTLTRLAAKIDIQWDAQEAYGEGYSDIKVTGFTFSGDNENVTGSGSGRLFPSLGKDNATQLTPLSGSKTFINRTPISQRNGRVYHYVYPDGVSTPKVKFNITAKKEENGSTTNVDNTYTYTFNSVLQKATWYKIRTYIKGFPEGQETNITITPEGPSEAVTTE